MGRAAHGGDENGRRRRMSATAPKVFLSYRREETAGHAGRLYDELAERLGPGNVFMDVDLAPGIDFVERITTAVDGCRALLVVMGPRWATGAAADGRPRIADPEDFVRLEVETALRSPTVTVTPVLVGGARMPPPEQLPDALRPLARRNAIELSYQRWRFDVGRLLDTIAGLLGARRPAPVSRVGPAQVAEGSALAAVVALLMLTLVEGINSAGSGDDTAKLATTIERNTLAWAIVAMVLAAWLAWRRGERRAVAGAALLGLLLGALGAGLGAAIFAVARFAIGEPFTEDGLQAVSVGSLALVGGGLGLALGRVWRPPRGTLGLGAGLAAGALIQLRLVVLDAPALPTDALRSNDELVAAIQAAAIAAGVLLALVATVQQTDGTAPPRQ